MVAGISRYATLMDLASDGRLTAQVEPFVRDLHATGIFRGGVVGFTTAYLYRPDELAAELTDAGLYDVTVYGIEGPAGPTLRALGIGLPRRTPRRRSPRRAHRRAGPRTHRRQRTSARRRPEPGTVTGPGAGGAK